MPLPAPEVRVDPGARGLTGLETHFWNDQPAIASLELNLEGFNTTIDARVVRLVVELRQPLSGGAPFGDAGPYERLEGTVYMEVDPRDPHDVVIVNVDRAPRNARGIRRRESANRW